MKYNYGTTPYTTGGGSFLFETNGATYFSMPESFFDSATNDKVVLSEPVYQAGGNLSAFVDQPLIITADEPIDPGGDGTIDVSIYYILHTA